jgi:hypothetical protein
VADPQLVELVIPGWVPSKKNLLKVTKAGHGYYDPEVKARLVEMEDEVRAQWAGREPLVHPAIGMWFALASSRSDRDNKFTTVLDCLVKGGVLVDDCIRDSNGPYVLMPSIVSKTPFTQVWIEPSGDIEPLVAKLDELKFLVQMPASPAIRKRVSRWKT